MLRRRSKTRVNAVDLEDKFGARGGPLADLERFIHAPEEASASGGALPALVRIALIHAQFETIHPFLDGNGRIGRLLIAALMEQWGLLREPLMYLSGYLKQHQAEYDRRLSAIRSEGNWEGWVAFAGEAGPLAYRLFELLPVMPRFTVEQARQRLATTFPTASAAVRLLEALGIVDELTGRRKNRVYGYRAYVEILGR